MNNQIKTEWHGKYPMMPTCNKCGTWVQPTDNMFCWKCPKCGAYWGACNDNDDEHKPELSPELMEIALKGLEKNRELLERLAD